MATRVQIKMVITTSRGELTLERESELTMPNGEIRAVLDLLDQMYPAARRFYEQETRL